MTDLKTVCGSMYRAKDQGGMIEQCISNPENRSLSNAALEQVKDKCGNLMPLDSARTCAGELGLVVPDPIATDQKTPPTQVPHVTYVESMTRMGKCDSDFINGRTNEDEWERCTLGDQVLGAVRAQEKINEANRRREERKNLTTWGKFALRLGVDTGIRHSLFKDAFTEWNTGKHVGDFIPAPSNNGEIDRGWRVGGRVTLGTEPGLARWPGGNVLFRGTVFDLSIYDDEGVDYGNEDFMPLGDDFRLTLLDFEVQIPLFERNFFEIGFSHNKEDILWWRNSTPVFMLIPTDWHIGLNWQPQGAPISLSDSVLDVTDAPYMLSGYTMLGVSVEVALANLYPHHKAVEFCSQVSEDCGRDISHRNDFFPYFDAEYSGLVGVFGDVFMAGDDYTLFQFKLQAHAFGEQRWKRGQISYRGFVDYYPTWGKIEAGGELSGHVYLGKAMEFYVDISGRNLWSLENDDNILLPDSGYEVNITSGIAFRPSAVF